VEYEYTLNEEQQELLVAILDAAWRQGATKRGLEEISSIIRTGGKKKLGPCRTCGRGRKYLI
jgi:hypothetical protein|tara:strand:+ start:537 stop:722 length:186 start_codon:yes stop_codon:yes gene_type:complete